MALCCGFTAGTPAEGETTHPPMLRMGPSRSLRERVLRQSVRFRPVADLRLTWQVWPMSIELLCASCGQILTATCNWGADEDYDRTSADREPAVPSGLLIRLSVENAVEVRHADGAVERKVYSPAGAIAANPENVVVANLHSVGKDNGCCGSDGMDGPNRACACGAVVATEWSDCWTQAEVRFLPDAVRPSPTT